VKHLAQKFDAKLVLERIVNRPIKIGLQVKSVYLHLR